MEINTHHAFLNTDIILSSSDSNVEIVDDLTGETYCINDKPIVTKLCAGKHRLFCKPTKEELTVKIEDAIKLGGGKLKDAFVFDNSPWVFVTTSDRLYIHNIDTDDEKVEFNISPEQIFSFDGRWDYDSKKNKACEYFLFRTKNDYAIFNVKDGSRSFCFHNHIYSNSHLIIFKKNEQVVVYDFLRNKTIVEFSGQYSFGKKFYYVKDGTLFGMNLGTSYINRVPIDTKVDEDCILSGNTLVKLHSDNSLQKVYHYYMMGNGEKEEFIEKIIIVLPCYIESWQGIETKKYKELKQHFDDFVKQVKRTVKEQDYDTINNLFPNIYFSFDSVRVTSLFARWESKRKIYSIRGEILHYPLDRFDGTIYNNGRPAIKIEGTIDGDDQIIHYRNTTLEISEIKSSNETKDSSINSTITDKHIIGKSHSEERYVTFENNTIMYHDKDKTAKQILCHTFDTSRYNNAYFSSDGKHVVFENTDNQIELLGFEDMVHKPFDIGGSSIDRFDGFNGYKPDILITNFYERTPICPVWIDPISLRKISPDEFSSHMYKSPDGQYTANLRMKEIPYNILTEQDLSIDEHEQFKQKYDLLVSDNEKRKKLKIQARKELINEWGEEKVFKHLYDIDSSSQIIQNMKSYYIEKEHHFTRLFIEIRGYVIYQKASETIDKRILIGQDVWFLNYVSFSYNSQYLSFGAKMKGDEFGYSPKGVFGLFDLQKEELVYNNIDEELYAVWMTMFSKRGDVSFYDSHANAYILKAESNYQDCDKIDGKSLLCFSPSGTYIAFSDQNYIDHEHHPGENWGHQPSGNIFIHKVNESSTCLQQFNDMGEGILGVATRANSVASAAFSSDEKRLLAVGTDGVIVIRNLHLPQ